MNALAVGILKLNRIKIGLRSYRTVAPQSSLIRASVLTNLPYLAS